MTPTGPWMQTYTARKFYPFDPRAEDVCIEDIAHALANTCRFGGHTKRFYSVAQHSVFVRNVARLEFKADADTQLHALMHDASEAYIADLIRPIKRRMNGYAEVENAITAAIFDRFKINPSPDSYELVKTCDNIVLATEARSPHLFSAPIDDWDKNIAEARVGEPFDIWSPDTAKLNFMNHFAELYKGE